MDSGLYLEIGDKVKYKDSYFSIKGIESGIVVIQSGKFGNQSSTIGLNESDSFQLSELIILLVKIKLHGFLFSIPEDFEKFEVERSNIELLNVHAYLPSADPDTELPILENIQNKVGDFLNEFGFEYYPEKDSIEIYGSWQWKSWFKRDKRRARNRTRVYDEMQETLNVQQVDNNSSDDLSKRASAAKDLIASLSDYDEGIIRLGDIYVAKAIINGKNRLLVENITPRLARELEKYPGLIFKPNEFLKFIEKDFF